MRTYIHILSLLLVLTFTLSGIKIYGQNESMLDFNVKKLNGETIELRDHMDPNSNYIIETMAFWCAPCVRSIDKFNYHKNYWNERFNVKILLIEDEHWNDLAYVESEMEEYGWDIEIVISDDQFSSVDINSIPRYYFKGVASDTVQRVYGSIEKFLIEKVDSIKYDPILQQDFKQVILGQDCDELQIQQYQVENDTTINEYTYQLINNTPFRESSQNGNIIRYDFEKGIEEVHIKYSAALCSRIWLKDLDGDSLSIKILDRYQIDSVLHIVTDQVITNDCSAEYIPFEFIQNIGSNAGLVFNIEDGQIVSRLVCHEREDEYVYLDDEFGNMCFSLSDENPTLKDLNIKTFPNPVSSKINITLNFDGEKKIEIYTSNGQQIKSQITNDVFAEIELPNDVESSLYLVKISTKYGVVTKKIVSFNQD